MRLRIRTLLLTIALLCSMTSTASACIYIPILDPFYWLFGGCGGYNGGNYGYANTGNSYGYGPNPYRVSRCIDDWLGYGYLRNQQGTLGHYPGRPISCYHPVFPHLLNPCSWFPPCPLFSPYGPSCGMTAPMVAPLAPPVQIPYQAQWQNQGPYQMPMPGMMNPYGGNCNDPCGSQCMPQPSMQYQPAQIPVATWRPMTVDHGRWRWQRVWVPRPRTMMVPQTQYAMSAPAMQMPLMQNPMMDFGCGDDCGGAGGCSGCGGDMGSMMPGAEYMQGTEMMQGTGYPDMNSGSGCCGSGSGIPQSGYESGAPAMPQSTMLMSPGSMPTSRMSMGQPHNIAPYTAMSRWYSNPRDSTAWNNPRYRPSIAARSAYGTAMYRQPQSRNFAHHPGMMAMPQSSGWQTVQMMPHQFQAMPTQRARPIQRAMSPSIGGMMPGTFYSQPMVAGDITGDHEFAGPSSAAVQIIPNSFNGRPPIRQASWSQPPRTTTARRYPNSVQ